MYKDSYLISDRIITRDRFCGAESGCEKGQTVLIFIGRRLHPGTSLILLSDLFKNAVLILLSPILHPFSGF